MKLTLIGNGIMAQSLARGLVKNHEVEIIGRDVDKLKAIQERIPQITIKALEENENITDKIVIFCDSEFWHGKDWETKKHNIKSNSEFWINKIEGNIKRDKIVNQKLQDDGWIVLRFWGKEIIKDINSCIQNIEKTVKFCSNKK